MKIKKNLLLLILSISIVVTTGCSLYYRPIIDDQIVGETFTVSLVDNKQVIYVKGLLETGISNDIKLLYKENRATVKAVKLSSQTGWYREAEKIHQFIKKYNLDSYAYSQCYGPCVIAFTGGKNRYAVGNVKFRIFGYNIFPGDTAGYATQWTRNVAKIRYARLLKKNGVKEEFIEKYINYKSKKNWMLEKYEMLESNIVHEYITSDMYSRYISSNDNDSKQTNDKQTINN